MNETRATGLAGRRAIATSLFGGAMLATVATASLAQQVTYFATAQALSDTPVTSGYVVLGANGVGDAGGGAFMPGPTCSLGDKGIVFQDGSHTPNCFYRADPTYSVREWGALCDVVDVDAAGAATWTNNGTLTVPTNLLPAPLSVVPGVIPAVFIAISQIGSPTLWGSSTPAVSMTRFSTFSKTGTVSNAGTLYKNGDIVSFAGGTFSQQAAIYVDAVDSNGAIAQWHFLWGGLYDPTSVQSFTTMAQDNAHTFCGAMTTDGTTTNNACGTTIAYGAIFAPAWSGWSVLNSQPILNAGSNYNVGDTVTLSIGDTFVNQGHYATLVVEGTTTSGGVAAFDWTDYGSFILSTISNTGTLAHMTSSGIGKGLMFSPVAWTQGPYASTIVSAGTVMGTGKTAIVVAGTAAFPGTIAIQSFYYGTDDSALIINALTAPIINTRTTPSSSALIIPAGCGTTVPLNLAVDPSSSNLNLTLVGSNLQSSGLYAFAYPPMNRSGQPILSSVLTAGILKYDGTGKTIQFVPASGGGFRNMLVEGFGIPEGYGYWGLAEHSGIPSGYVGPMFGEFTGNFNIPVSGSAVELDRTTYMRIDNVHISDGGIGMGNAAMFCGSGESDPGGVLNGDVGSIVFTDSRLDSNPAFFAGPSNPDVALHLHCHDSIFQNLTVFDGIKADVMGPGGNVFGQIHVGSSAINQTTATNGGGPIDWPMDSTLTNVGFAGVADYGVYVTGNTSLSQTRCDIADIACVFMSVDVTQGNYNPGQITDTQIGCAAFTSVPPGYGGVLLSAKTQGVTVSGTASAGKCVMAPAQLVSVLPGGALDPTTSLCNNSNAPIAGCTGYQAGLISGQYYTQPATTYGLAALSGGTTMSTLYAVPFYSPAGGGAISQLGLYVTTAGAAGTQCVLGVYSAFAGRPASRLTNGVTVSATGTGWQSGTVSTQLAPATLYFLAVGCTGTVTVEGVGSTGALTAPLTGAPNVTTTTTGLTTTWTVASGLPPAFGNTTIAAGGPVPNVYAEP